MSGPHLCPPQCHGERAGRRKEKVERERYVRGWESATERAGVKAGPKVELSILNKNIEDGESWIIVGLYY